MAKTRKPFLLVVEDDVGLQRQLKWAYEDYDILLAADVASALQLAETHAPQVATVDLGLPPDPDGTSEGFRLLEALRASFPHMKTIVASGHGTHRSALDAIALGAFDFYQKPINIDELGFIVSRAFHVAALEEENRRLSASVADIRLPGLVASSPEMLKVISMLERVAPSDASVLLLGASGTGKEILAHGLHLLSPRKEGEFVPINCGAIPENLLEAELFGYERGAFTGATRTTRGKIELAQGGTLFLDEIGDIPFQLQVKLLRFLQERVIERVGGRKPIEIDTRIVCATHRNLEEMIANQTFREDLYYRIAEIVVRIPPLGERKGDATLLAKHFLQQFTANRTPAPTGFTPAAIAAIDAYPWPGNVRELENRVKRAAIMADNPLITLDDLVLGDNRGTSPSLRDARLAADQRAVQAALAATDGNISAAAKILRISRPTLYDLMKELDIKP